MFRKCFLHSIESDHFLVYSRLVIPVISWAQAPDIMKFDDVLRIIGEFGRYQRIKFTLICVVAIISAFLSLNMVFVGGKPEHYCKVPDDIMEYYTNSSEGE